MMIFRKNHITIGFVFIALFSCNTKNDDSYDLLIEKDKLINIMVDLSIAESSLANFSGSDKDSIKDVYRLYIEQIYDLKMTDIDATLKLLYSKPELNMEIQKSVIDSLKSLEESSKSFK